MEPKGRAIDGFVKSPPAGLKAALICGPDAGSVRERAETLARSVCPDLSDPFRVAVLGAKEIEQDPARLADEAAAISMMGGRRVIRVRDARDATAAAFSSWLDQGPGDALVVVDAGELPKSSKLRKLFADGNETAVILCYGDEAGALEGVILDSLKAHGLKPDADALAFLTAQLGGDRGITRSELEKLALYCGPDAGIVTLADARQMVGDSADIGFDEVIDGACEGDPKRLDHGLSRLIADGTAAVQVLRVVQTHFNRLLTLRMGTDRGQSLDGLIRGMKPALPWPRQQALQRQVPRWPAIELGRALHLLVETEIQAKSTGMPDQAALGRALLSLAIKSGGRR